MSIQESGEGPEHEASRDVEILLDEARRFLEGSSEPMTASKIRALMGYAVSGHKMSAVLASNGPRKGIAKYREKGKFDRVYWGLADRHYKDFERLRR